MCHMCRGGVYSVDRRNVLRLPNFGHVMLLYCSIDLYVIVRWMAVSLHHVLHYCNHTTVR